MIAKTRQFIDEVLVELKKVTWTSRKDLINSTWIVFLSSIFLGAYIGLTDYVLSKCLGLLIN